MISKGFLIILLPQAYCTKSPIELAYPGMGLAIEVNEPFHRFLVVSEGVEIFTSMLKG